MFWVLSCILNVVFKDVIVLCDVDLEFCVVVFRIVM